MYYADDGVGFIPQRNIYVKYEDKSEGYKDPELENDKRRAKDFTPQEAQRLIEQWEKRERESGKEK